MNNESVVHILLKKKKCEQDENIRILVEELKLF